MLVPGKVFTAFHNLSLQARSLMVLRFSLALVAFCMYMVSLIGPLLTTKFYYVRINCSHLDVSKGIYESLRNSVSHSTTDPKYQNMGSRLPIDTSLTNSEITILSEYAEEKVEHAPQYFVGSLWQFCVGYYNITESTDSSGDITYTTHNDRLVCTKDSSQRSVFNYRATMESYSMDGVLAYSLQSSQYTDAKYNRAVAQQLRRYKSVPISLVLTCIFSLSCTVFTYVLYSNRKGSRDLTNVPKFLLHGMAVASVTPFVAGAVSTCSITLLSRNLRSDINSSFGSFGITLQMGILWYTITCFGLGATILQMLSWIIPVWCANP
ncbi:hypothetical protein CANTEDRAFT_109380, partial [Yamadazyma tenuis ATCC 10573]